MSLFALRILERIHGHLGWLAVIALLHPAIVLRRPKRRAPLAATLSTALALATGILGTTIYPEYRVRLKQAIFLDAPTLGWCFERKEHLGLFAITFALLGCVAHLAAPSFAKERQELVATMAHRAYVAAFALAALAAILGIAVAVQRTF